VTTLAPNDFTHLHVHSEFSLLDGLGRITELVHEITDICGEDVQTNPQGKIIRGGVRAQWLERSGGLPEDLDDTRGPEPAA